jgi:hypothetical protein
MTYPQAIGRTCFAAAVFGLATALGACAAHQPAPAPPSPAPAAPSSAAPRPDPFAGLPGKIVLTRQRLTGPYPSTSDFVASARALQTDRIPPSVEREGADRLWNVYFAAFLTGATTKGDMHLEFADLTGGKTEKVADGVWPLEGPHGGRAVYGVVQLAEPWFVPDRRYAMTVTIDGAATASTSFWLLAERDRDARDRADGAARTSAPASPPSPEIAAASAPAIDHDVTDRARRAPGSPACVAATAPDSGWTRQEARGGHASPGLRFRTPDKEAVRKVIRGHVPAVRACYENAMTKPPYPRGRLKSRFVVGPDGAVRGSCAVDSELKDAALDRCILDHLLTMKFPASIDEGWTVVEYPFVLEPADDAEPEPPRPSKRPAARGKK